MKRTVLFAIASALALGLAAPAHANAWNGHAAMRVSYEDLNLDRDAGASQLLGRIYNASVYVCGDYHGRMSLQERGMIRSCMIGAQQAAVHDVNRETVTALYYHRHPVITIASAAP